VIEKEQIQLRNRKFLSAACHLFGVSRTITAHSCAIATYLSFQYVNVRLGRIYQRV